MSGLHPLLINANPSERSWTEIEHSLREAGLIQRGADLQRLRPGLTEECVLRSSTEQES